MGEHNDAVPILGCGIEGMRGIYGDAALVLSDLPSGETEAAFDNPPDLASFWGATWQALRPDGVAVLMASNLRFASAVIASQPKAYRYDLIWHKTVATGFLNAKKRPLRAHEFVLVFTRKRATYNVQMEQGFEPIHLTNPGGAPKSENYGAYRTLGLRSGATDRYPRSVLRFNSIGQRDKVRMHPQQKPEPLLRWLVRTYSNPGDLVLDPFAGSGSTGRAALAEGRRFIGWDSDVRFGKRAG